MQRVCFSSSFLWFICQHGRDLGCWHAVGFDFNDAIFFIKFCTQLVVSGHEFKQLWWLSFCFSSSFSVLCYRKTFFSQIYPIPFDTLISFFFSQCNGRPSGSAYALSLMQTDSA